MENEKKVPFGTNPQELREKMKELKKNRVLNDYDFEVLDEIQKQWALSAEGKTGDSSIFIRFSKLLKKLTDLGISSNKDDLFSQGRELNKESPSANSILDKKKDNSDKEKEYFDYLRYCYETICAAETNSLPQLTINIEPGTAPEDEIATVLSELSLIYRKMGGNGIEFKLDGVTLKKEELV